MRNKQSFFSFTFHVKDMLLNHTKNDYEFIFGMHATAFANKDNNLLGTI